MRPIVRISIYTWLTAFLLAARIVVCAADSPTLDPEYARVAQLLSRGEADLLPTDGNDITIIPNGELKWQLLLADLEAAQHSICIEYFRWKNDKSGQLISDVIYRKLREGVQVKILLENVSNPLYRKDYYLKMQEAGAQVQFFTDTDRQLWEILPDIGVRNHRKIVVIDGKVGYLGGMNIADRYLNGWLDTHLRINGPAVTALSRLFDDMWEARKGPELKRLEAKALKNDKNVQCEPAEAKPEAVFAPGRIHNATMQVATAGAGDLLLEKGVCEIIDLAQRYVYIQTPYFCPPEKVLQSLFKAAGRGVDVRILIPAVSDVEMMTLANKSYFEECLLAGIHILTSDGTFNHSKTIVCDDNISVIGSMNLDNRSMHINHEVLGVIYGSEAASASRDLFLKRSEGALWVTLENIAALPEGKARAMKFWRRHSGLL